MKNILFLSGVFFSGLVVGMERLSIENKCKYKIKIECIITVPNHTYEVKPYSSFSVKVPAGKKKDLQSLEYIKVNLENLRTKDLVDVALTRSLVIRQDKNNLDEIVINNLVFPLVKIK